MDKLFTFASVLIIALFFSGIITMIERKNNEIKPCEIRNVPNVRIIVETVPEVEKPSPRMEFVHWISSLNPSSTVSKKVGTDSGEISENLVKSLAERYKNIDKDWKATTCTNIVVTVPEKYEEEAAIFELTVKNNSSIISTTPTPCEFRKSRKMMRDNSFLFLEEQEFINKGR